jgi:hypothetical protein
MRVQRASPFGDEGAMPLMAGLVIESAAAACGAKRSECVHA